MTVLVGGCHQVDATPLHCETAHRMLRCMEENRSLAIDRKRLADISPVAWEHPTDRAALQALRAVPGFDDVARRLIGFIGERGIRLVFQANAVRVGKSQLPELYSVFRDVLETLDWPEEPELFVSQTPFANAGAFGVDRPFIVVNSGTLHLLDTEETRAVLAHEVGHIMSGHALYHTLLVLMLNMSLSMMPRLAGIAVQPLRYALLEWYRKSELSSDRAALLATQDPHATLRVFLKLAGGSHGDQASLDAYIAQAKEYEASTGMVDRAFKILNAVGHPHPFNTLRAAALVHWIEQGAYDAILRGEYVRRGREPADRPKAAGFRDVGDYYAAEARVVMDDFMGSVRSVVAVISERLGGAPAVTLDPEGPPTDASGDAPPRK